MALSTIIKTKRDGTITITDGAANSLAVSLDVGDFAFDDASKPARVVLRDRGTICGVRNGDDEVIGFSFSAHFTEFTNAAGVALLDFCYKRNAASGYTSTGSGSFEPFMVSVSYTANATALGDAAAAVANFAKCILIASFAEGDSDTLTITGECYGGVTYTGIT